eukprot:m.4682 g.4682  ORF g.4682 m.4682 type:complete len:802 (+) comp2275_c0_seq1:198-2603(+)
MISLSWHSSSWSCDSTRVLLLVAVLIGLSSCVGVDAVQQESYYMCAEGHIVLSKDAVSVMSHLNFGKTGYLRSKCEMEIFSDIPFIAVVSFMDISLNDLLFVDKRPAVLNKPYLFHTGSRNFIHFTTSAIQSNSGGFKIDIFPHITPFFFSKLSQPYNITSSYVQALSISATDAPLSFDLLQTSNFYAIIVPQVNGSNSSHLSIKNQDCGTSMMDIVVTQLPANVEVYNLPIHIFFLQRTVLSTLVTPSKTFAVCSSLTVGYLPSGEVVSHAKYPYGNYAPNSACTLSLGVTSPLLAVAIYITEIDVQECCDIVRIRSGLSHAGRLYNGRSFIGEYGRSVSIEFSSDASYEGKGFQIFYQTIFSPSSALSWNSIISEYIRPDITLPPSTNVPASYVSCRDDTTTSFSGVIFSHQGYGSSHYNFDEGNFCDITLNPHTLSKYVVVYVDTVWYPPQFSTRVWDKFRATSPLTEGIVFKSNIGEPVSLEFSLERRLFSEIDGLEGFRILFQVVERDSDLISWDYLKSQMPSAPPREHSVSAAEMKYLPLYISIGVVGILLFVLLVIKKRQKQNNPPAYNVHNQQGFLDVDDMVRSTTDPPPLYGGALDRASASMTPTTSSSTLCSRGIQRSVLPSLDEEDDMLVNVSSNGRRNQHHQQNNEESSQLVREPMRLLLHQAVSIVLQQGRVLQLNDAPSIHDIQSPPPSYSPGLPPGYASPRRLSATSAHAHEQEHHESDVNPSLSSSISSHSPLGHGLFVFSDGSNATSTISNDAHDGCVGDVVERRLSSNVPLIVINDVIGESIA